jgi:Ca2+-transporting ATPase
MPRLQPILEKLSSTHAFWSLSVEKTLTLLKSRPTGLREKEAEKRLTEFGGNVINKRAGQSRLHLLIEQVESPLILILLAAAAVTGFLHEWLDTGVIIGAVIVNVALGFWQEDKARTILEHLASYIRVRARVRRDDQEREVDAANLVPGDIIHISQGDRIPADARLLFTNNLSVDESVLTGESLPVDKSAEPVGINASLAERTCMLYGGTLIVEGVGDAVITATDEATEFGKIAVLASQKKPEPTPLQKAIGHFSRQLGVILTIVTIALFALGLWLGHDPAAMFLIAVAVAVSIVPEGLPVALTVILAMGVERLAKKQGVIRKLLAAEALGSTTLILTDKTGTLTQAKMTLTDVIPWSTSTNKTDLLAEAITNMDVVIENPLDEHREWRLIGRPMETALIRDAAAQGVFLPERLSAVHVADRFPFHSRHKYSLSLVEKGAKRTAILVGAPDIMLPFTTLTVEEQKTLLAQIETRANSGERLLGVSHRSLTSKRTTFSLDDRPSGFTFQGLLTFRDPVRLQVKDSIARISKSGVRTIMITGDHPGTATTVGKELGMYSNTSTALTGEQLRQLSPKSLAAQADNVSIYARVTPEQKLDIVRMYQEKGEIVAVTGDGVNDAPALEAADIGIAVGSGTDVAKSAADLIILDDNFETIVLAIEEGRRILGNIRKVLIYLLSSVVDSVLLIGGALLLGIPLPLNPLQILFVNFFSDSFPAIAFAFEEHNDLHDVRGKTKTLFDNEMKVMIWVLGISSSILLFLLYIGLLRAGQNPEVVRTFIFASFATYTLFMTFSLRSLQKSILTYNPFSNLSLTAGVGIGVTLTLCAVYIPWMQQALHTVALPSEWILGVGAVSLLNMLGVEMIKWLVRKRVIKT